MNVTSIETIPPKTLSAWGGHELQAPPAPCRPLDGILDASLTLCARLANCVAAIENAWSVTICVAAVENTWGLTIGSEPFLAAWTVLHGVAQAGRARTHRAATSSPAAPACLRFTWKPVGGA